MQQGKRSPCLPGPRELSWTFRIQVQSSYETGHGAEALSVKAGAVTSTPPNSSRI